MTLYDLLKEQFLNYVFNFVTVSIIDSWFPSYPWGTLTSHTQGYNYIRFAPNFQKWFNTYWKSIVTPSTTINSQACVTVKFLAAFTNQWANSYGSFATAGMMVLLNPQYKVVGADTFPVFPAAIYLGVYHGSGASTPSFFMQVRAYPDYADHAVTDVPYYAELDASDSDNLTLGEVDYEYNLQSVDFYSPHFYELNILYSLDAAGTTYSLVLILKRDGVIVNTTTTPLKDSLYMVDKGVTVAFGGEFDEAYPGGPLRYFGIDLYSLEVTS